MTDTQLPATGDGVLDDLLDKLIDEHETAARKALSAKQVYQIDDEAYGDVQIAIGACGMTRAAIHSYVSTAVQEAVIQERAWWVANKNYVKPIITTGSARWAYANFSAKIQHFYDSIDTLISSEQEQEKT